MNYSELLTALNLHNTEIIATIINPLRKDDIYKEGKVIGFKPGTFGGGHSNWKKDNKDGIGTSQPHSFSSMRMHWIKKPKVLIVYNIFVFHGKEHFDWIDVDNCTFEIKQIK